MDRRIYKKDLRVRLSGLLELRYGTASEHIPPMQPGIKGDQQRINSRLTQDLLIPNNLIP
jgi:hypothetical protein